PQMQLPPTSTAFSHSHEEQTLAPAAPPGPFLPETMPASPAPAESSLPWMDAPTSATSGADTPLPSVRRARKESLWWLWLLLPLPFARPSSESEEPVRSVRILAAR